MYIETVVDQGESYLVNGSTTVPKGSPSWLLQAINKWIDEGNNPANPPAPTPEEIAARIPALRYEQERQGVTVNGIRYSGDESNHQALREAVDMAAELGFTEFPTWKDSDGNYVANHPADDVKQALLAIGQRRSELIAKEGQFVAQALTGELTDVDGLDWS